MQTINIAKFIKELNIFDDSEYCESGRCINDWCGKLFTGPGPGYCTLFTNNHAYVFLNYDTEKDAYIKCDQCKKVWKKAKENKNGDLKSEIRLMKHTISRLEKVITEYMERNPKQQD